MTADSTNEPKPVVDPEVIRRLLHGVPLGANQTFIIARGPQVLAHRGALKLVEAADVAIYVDDAWQDSGQIMRVQFMRLPLLPADRLLLTYPLREQYRLTLVDIEDASLDQLRNLGSQLLGVLEVAGITR
jgi:hypothetical protein